MFQLAGRSVIRRFLPPMLLLCAAGLSTRVAGAGENETTVSTSTLLPATAASPTAVNKTSSPTNTSADTTTTAPVITTATTTAAPLPSPTSSTTVTTTASPSTTTTLTAPQILGECSEVTSTNQSLTFKWPSATSETSYRLVGHELDETSTENMITVNGLTPGSYYTFTVWAVDTHGLVSDNITCINSTDPDRPSVTPITDITQTSVTLSWSVGQTGVVNDTLVYYRTTESGEWTSNSVSETTHTVGSLQPGTRYQFYVKVNSYGKTSTSANVTATTDPDRPSTTGFTDITQTSVTISWSVGQTQVVNDTLVYYRATGSAGWTSVSVTGTIHTVSSLQPGTQYQFYVEINSYGKTSASDQVTATTDPDIPSITGFTDITQTSVTISWSVGQTQHVNTTLVYYRATGSEVWTYDPVTGNTHTVDSLLAGTQYQFIVQVNSYGKTSASENVTSTTAPWIRGDCKYANSTTESLTFRWSLAQSATAATYNLVGHSVNESSTTNMITVNDLTPGSYYTFTVWAVDSEGLGSNTISCADSTDPDVPTLVEVTNVHQTSATLEWNDGNTAVINSSRVFYVDTSSMSSWQTTNTVNHLTGLTPGRTYLFYLRVTSFDKMAESLNHTVITLPFQNGTCNSASSTSSSVALYWLRTQSATYYQITYSRPNGEMMTLNVTSTSVNVTSLTAGYLYTFYLQSFSAGGASSKSNCSYSTYPEISYTLTASDVTQTSVSLSWSILDTRHFDRIRVHQKRVDSSAEEWLNASSTSSHTVRSLTAGTTYEFYVQIYSYGNSAKTSTITVTTVPSLSRDCELVSSTNRSLTFRWTPAKSATSYHVVGHSKITSTQTNTVTIHGLNPGSHYAFGVRAVGSQGLLSNSINCVDSTDPDVPTEPVVSDRQETSVKLSWQPGESQVINRTSILYRKSSAHESWRRQIVPSSEKVGRSPKSSDESEVFVLSGLEQDTEYITRVEVQSFDKISQSAYTIFKTLAPAPVGLIVGVVFAVIIIIAIIVVIVLVIIWRRRRAPKSPAVREPSHADPVKRVTLFPVKSTRPIPFDAFSDHVAMMEKDTGLEYSNEFEELSLVGKEQAFDEADLPCNRAKNRYANIKPYDVSRVKLLPVEDEDGSDYINACWMAGFSSKREFIAAQGPLPSTTDDFWRMIWEYSCRAIVMVTKCMEAGRIKCDQYWPSDMEPIFYGDLQVTIINEDTSCSMWTVREIQISMGQQTRRLRQFHYLEWPDSGVPTDRLSLLSFNELVRDLIPARGGPIVVHCSAGVGRTGTFIAIDTLLHQINHQSQQQQKQEQRTVDVFGVVYRMRMNRVAMVQTEAQYVFIHDVIKYKLESLGYGMTSSANDDDDDDDDAISADESKIPIQRELQGNFYYNT